MVPLAFTFATSSHSLMLGAGAVGAAGSAVVPSGWANDGSGAGRLGLYARLSGAARRSNWRREGGGQGGGGGGDGWTRGSAQPAASPSQQQQAQQARLPNKNKNLPIAPPKKIITDPTELMSNELMGILNKITPQTFDKLSLKVKALKVENTDMLSKIIEYIFEKAVVEQTFTSTYAALCEYLNANSEWVFYHVVQNNDDNQYFWVMDHKFAEEMAGPFPSIKTCIQEVAHSDLNKPMPPMVEVPGTIEWDSNAEACFLASNMLMKIKKVEGSQPAEYYVSYTNFSDIEKEKRSDSMFAGKEDATSDARKKSGIRYRLVNVCQKEFQKAANNEKQLQDFDTKRLKLIEEAKAGHTSTTEGEYLAMLEELDLERAKVKLRMLGNIRFVGELYKKGMLSTSVMHSCITDLLEYEGVWKKNCEDQDIELLCHLLSTIGEQLELKSGTKQIAQFERYFQRMTNLSKDKTIKSRMRFTIEEVLVLRGNGWKSRRPQEGPLKIDELNKKVEGEQRREQMEIQQKNQGGPRGGPGFGPPGGAQRGGNPNAPRGAPQGQPPQGRTVSDPRQNNQGQGQGQGRMQDVRGNNSAQAGGRGNSGPGNSSSGGGSGGGKGGGGGAGIASGKSDASSSYSLKKDDVDSKVKSAVNDFVRMNYDVEEFSLCIKDAPPVYFITLVRTLIDKMIESKESERVQLLSLLELPFVTGSLKSNADKLMKELAGFDSCKFLPDICVDCKNAPDIVASIFLALVKIKVTTATAITTIIDEFKVLNVADGIFSAAEIEAAFGTLLTRFKAGAK